MALKRRTPLGRSRRAELRAPDRQALVAKILQARPRCERCRDEPSAHVHELKTRARGGSIFDPKNCVALGIECHRWIHDHPALASAEGWLIHSWQASPDVPEASCLPSDPHAQEGQGTSGVMRSASHRGSV